MTLATCFYHRCFRPRLAGPCIATSACGLSVPSFRCFRPLRIARVNHHRGACSSSGIRLLWPVLHFPLPAVDHFVWVTRPSPSPAGLLGPSAPALPRALADVSSGYRLRLRALHPSTASSAFNDPVGPAFRPPVRFRFKRLQPRRPFAASAPELRSISAKPVQIANLFLHFLLVVPQVARFQRVARADFFASTAFWRAFLPRFSRFRAQFRGAGRVGLAGEVVPGRVVARQEHQPCAGLGR